MPKKKAVKKTAKKNVKQKEESTDDPHNQRKGCGPNCAFIIGVCAVAILFLSFYFIPQWHAERVQEEQSYNEFNLFIGDDGLWYIEIEVNGNPYTIVMHHHPSEVDNISVQEGVVSLINAYANKAAAGGDAQAYLTMNPDAPAADAIAGVELAKVLGEKFNIYNIPTSPAFSRPSASSAYPVVTCQDADEETLVIYIREDDRSFVGTPQNYPYCVVVQGGDANATIMAADRLVYGLFGVIA